MTPHHYGCIHNSSLPTHFKRLAFALASQIKARYFLIADSRILPGAHDLMLRYLNIVTPTYNLGTTSFMTMSTNMQSWPNLLHCFSQRVTASLPPIVTGITIPSWRRMRDENVYVRGYCFPEGLRFLSRILKRPVPSFSRAERSARRAEDS